MLNGAAERITEFVALARRYPEARLVFTGGSGFVFTGDLREADVISDVLDGLGFDISRIAFERESRNTYENAVFSRPLVDPEPGETWLLITSAAHMPAPWNFPPRWLAGPGISGGLPEHQRLTWSPTCFPASMPSMKACGNGLV